jgi:arabinan endo-1,5-alpha-L-arabinosidase
MVLIRLALAATFLLVTGMAHAQDAQPTLTGDIVVHDPSVIEVDGKFVSFQTGEEGGIYRGAIRAKTSPDGIAWTDAGSIGEGLPEWVHETLGYRPRNIWAPSVSRHGDIWNLYYSVSSFGINRSAIGLMTNGALDPNKPGEGWQDQGVVLQSNGKDNFNAIDPWRIDTSDGRAFLAFGSFWDGIKMRELDPSTGKLIAEDTPTISLASRQGAGIEAASILEHEGKFFLFVSFDQCCKGAASTYNIRVGRADAVTGPYLDRDGKPMLRGGGSLLLGTTGRFIGPGAQEAINTSQGEMLAYHYYDRADRGLPKLQLSPLGWTADGWPELGALPN